MHDHHVIWLWILGAYPFIQGAFNVAVANLPKPEQVQNKWYPAIYKTIQYIADYGQKR